MDGIIEIKGIINKKSLKPSYGLYGLIKINILGNRIKTKIKKTLKLNPLISFLKCMDIFFIKKKNKTKLKIINSGIL